MGLGKTLTALALVAGSASTVSSHAKSPERTTLIITLLSSKFPDNSEARDVRSHTDTKELQDVTTWEEEIEKLVVSAKQTVKVVETPLIK